MLQHWRIWPLPVVITATLAGLVGAPAAIDYLAAAALLVYATVEWPRHSRLARTLLMVAAVLGVWVLMRAAAPAQVLAAAARQAAFYATFITCLGLLRIAAEDSRLVRRCGAALIRQPPRWRYATLALGSTVFGLVLGLGVVALLGAMSLKGNTLNAAGGHEVIQRVRRQRMLAAILRGFALVPLVSPIGICLVVILSTMPGIRWVDIIPYAYGTALVLFLLGWALDRRAAPRHLAALVPPQPAADMRPLGRFTVLVGAIIVFTAATAWAGGVSLPVAVLFTVPISTFIWMSVQRRRRNNGLGIRLAGAVVARRAPGVFPGLRGEVIILGSAGFIGEALSALLPQAWLAGRLVATGVHGSVLAAAASALVVALAQLGLNPIISTTLLASIFADPAALGVPAPLFAVGLMAGWSLSMVSSPLTASMLTIARLAGCSPYTVGYRWNGPFLLIALAMLALAYSLLGRVLF